MKIERAVERILKDSMQTINDTIEYSKDTITESSKIIMDCVYNGNKILLFGNGGSAGDAQHIAAEFVNRFMIERRPLPAIALTTDTSVITSISNDYSYDEIFSKQILALGQPNDIAFGISTSGTSKNVILGLDEAKKKGLKTILLTGDTTHKYLYDVVVGVPSKITARIQECHIIIGHIICTMVDENFVD